MSKPPLKANPRLYHACRALCRLWFRLAHRAKFIHPERIPVTGPCLIVANHQSYYDPPLIGCPMHRRMITFLARASLAGAPLAGPLIRRLNTVPIRDNEGDIRAIRDIIERLKNGEAVVIFPEGSRTFDGRMQPFREGAALILRKANCPVIPVAVEGGFDAFPRTRSRPRLGVRLCVLYGEPIPPEQLRGKDASAIIERTIADMCESLRSECPSVRRGNPSHDEPG